MPDTREPQSVVEAAEQAAAAGDYASAEQLLREAALLQEASLGPLHPDLANTLNNLGIVCEITEKPIDAEDFFRRASAIASAVLEPEHPFVATSRKNLEDFCASRGKVVDSPSAASIDDAAASEDTAASDEAASAVSAPSAVVPEAIPAIPPAAMNTTLSTTNRNMPATTSDELPPEQPSSEESRPVASRKSSRPLAIGALIAGGLLITLIATATWFRSNDQVESSPGNPSVSPESPAPTTAPPSVAPPIATDAPKETGTGRGAPVAAKPEGGVTIPTPPAAQPARESPALPSARAENRTAPPAGQSPAVVTAHLCKDFSTRSGDWRCVAPALPAGPGPLVFYTRLKSPIATTVQHRWYRDDRLHQAVELPIRANTTAGYRTYSRQTVDSRGAGAWRVELRTRDGVLLHEERFAVR